MSVFNTKYEDHCDAMGRFVCTVCEGELLYPFLGWDNLNICGACCVEIKQGLIADLIHITAIVELQDLGYSDTTLVRKTIKAVEEKGKACEAVEKYFSSRRLYAAVAEGRKNDLDQYEAGVRETVMSTTVDELIKAINEKDVEVDVKFFLNERGYIVTERLVDEITRRVWQRMEAA